MRPVITALAMSAALTLGPGAALAQERPVDRGAMSERFATMERMGERMGEVRGEEREAALLEHMRLMNEQMGAMRGMMRARGAMAGRGMGDQRMDGGDAAAMEERLEVMEERMDSMQRMMEQMLRQQDMMMRGRRG